MHYTPITPFGRPVDAVLMEHHAAADCALPASGVDKWIVLRELGAARTRLGVTDRSLGVLQALISFYPHVILGGDSTDTVVFPSNAAICARLNGMPCSTMRRHLAGLVRAGLVIRRDSPNGKRFRRVHHGGSDAYGFDLAPLILRFDEIRDAAESSRAEADAHARLRRSVSLMRRDLAALAVFGLETLPDLPLWVRFSDLATLTARALRRKLVLEELRAIADALSAALNEARDVLDADHGTGILDTSAPRIEHRHQNSDKDLTDFEQSERANLPNSHKPVHAPPAILVDNEEERPIGDDVQLDCNRKLPNIPLKMVLAACQEFKTYIPDRVRHWHELVQAADILSPMMGISRSVWRQAVISMGPEEAASTVLCMLDRMHDIRSPGAYLRRLSQLAEADAFSCGPMVVALLKRDGEAPRQVDCNPVSSQL